MNAVAPTLPSKSQNPHSDTGRAVRGALWLTVAKVLFIVTSYGIQFLLPRLLGNAETFGDFSAATNLMILLTNVIVVSVTQSLSRQLNAFTNNARSLFKRALFYQLAVGATLGTLFYFARHWLAAQVLSDARLADLLAPLSIAVGCYAVYATCVGAFNGTHRFKDQAKLDMVFSVLRTVGVLGGAFLGWRALGATWGLGLASLGVMTVAVILVFTQIKDTQPLQGPNPLTLERWSKAILTLSIYHLCLNALMQVDLSILKHQSTSFFLARAYSTLEAANASSRLAGYYRAAQTFAFVPYQLTLSFSFVLFPQIAKLNELGDAHAMRRAIRRGLFSSTAILVVCALAITLFASFFMHFVFPSDYAVGASALYYLVWAQVALSLFALSGSVLNASGQSRLAIAIAVIAVISLFFFANLFAQVSTDTAANLRNMAKATLAATSLAATLALIVVYLRHRQTK